MLISYENPIYEKYFKKLLQNDIYFGDHWTGE